MKIVYHLGAHATDEERLLRCLLKNRGILGQQGIVVPGPTRYRNLLRDTAIALKGKPATAETEALVLEQIIEEDKADRLVLSWDNFLAFLPWAVDGTLYPAAGARMQAFSQVFPNCAAEFHLAIRNPASFLPEVFGRQRTMKGGKATYADFTKGIDIFDLRWSDVILRLQEANPGAALTVWCDEDTPLIWPEVVQAVSGHAPGSVLEDVDALLAEIMSPEGLTRMTAYLDSHPVTTIAGRRKIVSAFLEKFAIPAKVEQDVEIEGWEAATVDALTATYAEDVALIATLPGVTLLRP